MIACLRLIGILNAAVWLGTLIFVSFGAGPAASSQDMRQLLGPSNYPYFSTAIAQVLLTRGFRWQLACVLVAVAHLVIEGLYLGKGPRRVRLGLLVGLFWLNLLGGLWIQPKLGYFHLVEFGAGATPERRQAAHRSASLWQGVAATVNGLGMVGVAIYLWRVANPPEAARLGRGLKFRG